MLPERAAEEIDATLRRYPDSQSALLPALRIAQNVYGWLSPEALEEIALKLNIPRATVRGVATFHVLYRNKPLGRNLIQLCTNVACMLFGAESLVDLLKEKYGLAPGGTTEDGRFSLIIMECIGACDKGPAMLINSNLHENLSVENIEEILSAYE